MSSRHYNRRQIMSAGLGGVATLSMPGFLTSCAKQVDIQSGNLPENPFFEWFGIDQISLSKVMAVLTARGADHADLFFEHKRSCNITLEDGIISEANTAIDQGVGLRVVIGEQVGYAFTEEITLKAMLGAAQTAAAIAKGTKATAPQSFEFRPTAQHYDLAVPWSDVGVAQKLPILRKLEGLAKNKDNRIQKVRISWADSDSRILVASLDGNIVVDRRPMTRLWCNLVAKSGEDTVSQGANMAGRQGIEWYSDDKLELIAQQAADRTLILFDAIRPPAGEMPVVLDAGASGILLHEAIGHGMEADFNRKGVSIYSDMLGKKVAPDFVTIVDNGTQDHTRGALNVDDSGV